MIDDTQLEHWGEKSGGSAPCPAPIPRAAQYPREWSDLESNSVTHHPKSLPRLSAGLGVHRIQQAPGYLYGQ